MNKAEVLKELEEKSGVASLKLPAHQKD